MQKDIKRFKMAIIILVCIIAAAFVCGCASDKEQMPEEKPKEANVMTDSAAESGKFEHSVVFTDSGGEVLSSETVKDGGEAAPPNAPYREGYIFVGWDTPLENVTSDIVVTPIYERQTESPAFTVDRVTAKAGGEIAVNVSVENNPGIASASLDIMYDKEHLKLIGFDYGEEMTKGFLTVPYNENADPPCISIVNNSGNTYQNGVLATLHFEAVGNEAGTYPVLVTYDAENVYSIDEQNVAFDVVNGSITIE